MWLISISKQYHVAIYHKKNNVMCTNKGWYMILSKVNSFAFLFCLKKLISFKLTYNKILFILFNAATITLNNMLSIPLNMSCISLLSSAYDAIYSSYLQYSVST